MRQRALPSAATATLVMIVLACGLIAASCGDRVQAPDRATLKTATAAVTADIRGVNQLTIGNTVLHNGLFNYGLFLRLLEEETSPSQPATFKPLIGQSWSFSEDRLALTFELRQDLVWSDGEPITAEDVRFTWEAQTHPDVAWDYASSKEHIIDVEVLDPFTVRFHYEEVYATQLLDATEGVILPKHAWSVLPFSEWRDHSEWFIDNLVVSGPFRLEAWNPGESIVLRRNERYFRPGHPKVDRLVFRIIPDQMGQLALLRSGEVHTTDWAYPSDAEMLSADPDIEILTYTLRSFQALAWNNRLAFFSTPRLRRALTFAIDRQKIVDSLHYGYATVDESPYTSDLWAHNSQLEPRSYDPQRAREIMTAEGWSDSDGDGVLDKNGVRFSFEILTLSGNKLREDMLVMIQEDLARLGIEARHRTIEFNTLFDLQKSGDFEACLISLGLPSNLDLGFFVHSDPVKGSFNFSKYSNPEVDRRLEELEVQIDQLAAKPLYDEFQALLHEEQPVTYLYDSIRLVPVRKTLQGVKPNALSLYYHLDEWELAGGK